MKMERILSELVDELLRLIDVISDLEERVAKLEAKR